MTNESEGDFSAPQCHVICCTGPSSKVRQGEGEPLRKEHSSHHRTLGVRFLGPIVYPVGGSRYHLPILDEGAGIGYRGSGGVQVGVCREGSDSPQGAGSCCPSCYARSRQTRVLGRSRGTSLTLRGVVHNDPDNHPVHQPRLDMNGKGDCDQDGKDLCSNCKRLPTELESGTVTAAASEAKQQGANTSASLHGAEVVEDADDDARTAEAARTGGRGRQEEGEEPTNSPRCVHFFESGKEETVAKKQETSEEDAMSETAATSAPETNQGGPDASTSSSHVAIIVGDNTTDTPASHSTRTAESTRTDVGTYPEEGKETSAGDLQVQIQLEMAGEEAMEKTQEGGIGEASGLNSIRLERVYKEV